MEVAISTSHASRIWDRSEAFVPSMRTRKSEASMSVHNSPLPGDDVARALQANGGHRGCTTCNNPHLTIINEELMKSRAAIPLFDFPEYDIHKATTAGVIILKCEKCFTLRLVLREPIEQWIAAHPR